MDSDDTIIISGDSTITTNSGYGAVPNYSYNGMIGTDTITLDAGMFNTGSINTSMNWTNNSYEDLGYHISPSDPSVNITHAGVNIKEEADLKIGDRSLKDFMNRVEDQLAILRPAAELEERWNQLRDLRRQYEECKQDIIEKEKIIKILKED